MLKRCEWADNELMIQYHDNEWGVPLHEDRKLFEFLTLEGAQAGLSWATILKRRERYRNAFDNFDPAEISKYGQKDVKRLLGDDGIIRNRSKILSTISNAKCLLQIQKEHGSFDRYIWSFVSHKQIVNHRRSLRELPARTHVSDKMSKALKGKGFTFVGPTICYAFMQAVGMVNDHVVYCFRH
ncbi:MAG: DNA-3-methyladenine glycosylase I [Thaumarchaeota archaeon]|nr:DNA-3-methyladenine glycosylase I [Nitrososphaerota archaeon]MCS4540521.1 DNA-3-methyladenine glycosylase I [Nitrososphaerota archaeon]